MMINENKDSESHNLRYKAEELLKTKSSQPYSPLSSIETDKLIHELQVHQIELELQNEELILARLNEQKIASKYTELYDLAPSGYFTLSVEGEILNLNLCGSQMLGKERAKLRNSRFAFFVSPDTRPIFNLFLEKVFQNKGKGTCEVTLTTQIDIPTHVLLTGIIAENQEQCNVTMVDMTELKEAENKIGQLNQTLELQIADRTNQLMMVNDELTFHLSEIEQFSYVSNHDLQEPLRTIVQFTKLFHEKYAGTIDEEGKKYIEFISKSATRMSALVKDLFDYSLLGKESVATNLDCNMIVKAVLSDLDDSINRSSAKITFQELPTINGYETELRLLFQNLLENAIKYQKPGGVPEINISAENHEREWLFSISDNGIGIDQKSFAKIFIIFQRLHNRNKFEGTGIGLAHCKKIVEMHGGKIWVESTPGYGSTFMFTIPK